MSVRVSSSGSLAPLHLSVLAAALVELLGWPTPCSAQAAHSATTQEFLRGYSPYEQATILAALDHIHASLDPQPEGKIIERIEIIPLDVIEERDPAPALLNWFHATSQPGIIRQEVLLSVGQPYRRVLADETARNLRTLKQLSLVLCFAARGSDDTKVRLVVVTKDVWSLRLNTNYRIAGGALEYLFLQPSEENLFGIHHAISAQIILDPGSLSLGGRYVVPRIGDSHLLFRSEVNAILSRETGKPEGSFGTFIYGLPLYATEAEWSWGAIISWRNEVTRRFVGTSLVGFDADSTPQDDAIPYVYRSDLLSGSYTVIRSFGRDVKHDFSVSLEASRRIFRAPDLSSFVPTAVAEFKSKAMPVSDVRLGPAFEYHTYSTNFMQVLDFNTLALQEDYRLGHDLTFKLYPVTTALNSSRDFVGFKATLAYTVPFGDGLARAVVESITEAEPTLLSDASISIAARIHTPSFYIGRLVFDAEVLDRYRNYLNKKSALGGDTRLRGYPASAFLGQNAFAANLEFRTRPLEIWSFQLAGAAFFDVGDAFDGRDDLRIKQSAGFGIRTLFPQLERVVMRIDWGFPLTPGYDDSFPGDIIWTFKQAFPMPAPTVPSSL